MYDYRTWFYLFYSDCNMKEEINQMIQERILQIGASGVSVHIDGTDAVSIMEAIYEKGRKDSEREIRESIAKRESEEFLTKAETMALLNKSENTLWKWNKKGYLRWVKHGGTIVYKKSSVLAIMNGTLDVDSKTNCHE